MKEQLKNELLDRNQKIIDMVIERVKRDFYEDIAVVGLTGSFSRTDFYEKSDLDLIIVNDTDKGWGICSCFILDDIGFDIYCTPWETRLEDQANLKSFAVGSLVDLEIIYSRDEASLKKLQGLQKRAMDQLNKPISEDCLNRAGETLNKAKTHYGDMSITDNLNDVRYASSKLLFDLFNTVVSINNTYIKRGTINYMEELATYTHVPKDFSLLYMSTIEANNVEAIRKSSLRILKLVSSFLDDMKSTYIEKNTPSKDNLKGAYEELWCNCKNKLIRASKIDDPNYAINAAKSAQELLDDLEWCVGTKKYELMTLFDAHNMTPFKDRFIEIMEDFADEYHKAGVEIVTYENLDDLYKAFMK